MQAVDHLETALSAGVAHVPRTRQEGQVGGYAERVPAQNGRRIEYRDQSFPVLPSHQKKKKATLYGFNTVVATSSSS